MSQQFVYVARHEPVPAQLIDTDRAHQLLALNHLVYGEHRCDGFGDTEDFYENLARLQAAISTLGAHNLWLDHLDGSMTLIGDLLEPRRSAQTLQHDLELSWPRLGVQASIPHYSSAYISGNQTYTLNTDLQADDYLSIPGFAYLSDRAMTILDFADIEDHLSEAVDEVLTNYAAEGYDRAWVKLASSKAGIAQIDLATRRSTDHHEAAPELADLLFTADQRQCAIQIAPHIEMVAEYRIFIVDHRPVTGAGCIEHHTPLDHQGLNPFDPAVEIIRGQDEIANRPAVVEQYLRRVHELLGLMQIPANCTIDLATDRSDGHPVVIEINALLNSGLYACDIQRLTEAIVAAPQHITAETAAAVPRWL